MMTWGPYFWGTLHIACLVAPPVLSDEHKAAYRDFVHSYTMILPCPACRHHFHEILEQFPIENHLATGKELFAWSVTVHNIVNMKLGKPVVSFREALMYWIERSNYDERFPIEDTLIVLGLVVAVYFLLIK
jgi:FAD-linked sulfhydryl oxidase